MTPEEAIAIVAQLTMASLCEAAWYSGELHPEIGEHDWESVCNRVEALTPYPDRNEYDAAYQILADRAENDA